MSAKHTPGPWKVYTSPDGSKVIGIGDSNSEGVADCGFGVWRGGDDEALANARLMAAAPELLDALKAMRAVAKRTPELQGREFVSLGIQVNNAIDKAGG